jgi:hypothetical protein
MNHQEIEQQEIIERYVRRQLPPAERRAFQEHYFECEECFEQTQTMTRFIAGVRQAARQGALSEAASEKEVWWASLFNPARGVVVAVTLALAIVFGWLFFKFKQPSAPRQQAMREQSQSPTPVAGRQPGLSTSPQQETEKNDRPKPQNPPNSSTTPSQRELLAQNRTPTVLLESARDANRNGNQLTIPANADRAILRVETEPGAMFESFQLQLFDAMRRPVTTIKGIKTHPNGALAVSVPADLLPTGKYQIRLFGIQGGKPALVGEYDLNVGRQ